MTHSMMRLRKVLAALSLAATASTAGGCSFVSRFVPGMDRPQMARKMMDPARTRDALRTQRKIAWAALREGKALEGYSAADALALSEAEQALDAQASWVSRPAAGRASFADLPRSYWWYLFVDPAMWSEGPLAIDRRELPGFYAAMMHAFDQTLADASAPGSMASGTATLAGAPAAMVARALGADDYMTMHQLVTLGVFSAKAGGAEPQGFLAEPAMFEIAPLHDPDVTHRELLSQSLAEMRAEGLAAWNPDVQKAKSEDPVSPWFAAVLEGVADINPHSKPAHLVYVRGRDADGAPQFAQYLRAANSYAPGEARNWTAQWFAAYDTEMRGITSGLSPASYYDALAAAGEPSEAMLAMVRPVVRLVRRLQVSHVFAAGGARLDTRLLLNKLLMQQGLPPAIVKDPTFFAGRAPVDAMAREIIAGQRRFQMLVTELAAREAAPPVSTAAFSKTAMY